MRLLSFLVTCLVCIKEPFTKLFTVVLFEPCVLCCRTSVDCCVAMGLFPFLINILHPVVVDLTAKFNLCCNHYLCVWDFRYTMILVLCWLSSHALKYISAPFCPGMYSWVNMAVRYSMYFALEDADVLTFS